MQRLFDHLVEPNAFGIIVFPKNGYKTPLACNEFEHPDRRLNEFE
jgi:hypothetical protein